MGRTKVGQGGQECIPEAAAVPVVPVSAFGVRPLCSISVRERKHGFTGNAPATVQHGDSTTQSY